MAQVFDEPVGGGLGQVIGEDGAPRHLVKQTAFDGA
jgi:hypothetical protein